MQISFNLKPDLLAHVDEVRGLQSRSAFITACIYEHFQGGDADKIQLLRDIEAYKDTQRRLENEVAYLREQYSKINDALAQRLLTENTHKKSFWKRITGR
jgi:metal-responsive CopG/Arc/MetJ family transcriptional regulator